MCSFLLIIFREVLKVFAVIAIICSFHFIRNPDIGMIGSINAFRNDLFAIKRNYGVHLPHQILSTEKKKWPQKPYDMCRRCGVRHDTRYYCKACDAALCKSPCFEEYYL